MSKNNIVLFKCTVSHAKNQFAVISKYKDEEKKSVETSLLCATIHTMGKTKSYPPEMASYVADLKIELPIKKTAVRTFTLKSASQLILERANTSCNINDQMWIFITFFISGLLHSPLAMYIVVLLLYSVHVLVLRFLSLISFFIFISLSICVQSIYATVTHCTKTRISMDKYLISQNHIANNTVTVTTSAIRFAS